MLAASLVLPRKATRAAGQNGPVSWPQTPDPLNVTAHYSSCEIAAKPDLYGRPRTDRMMSKNNQKIRAAIIDNLSSIVRLLTDDDLGPLCEDVTEASRVAYKSAFDDIQRDPNSQLLVAVSDGTVVGSPRLTSITGFISAPFPLCVEYMIADLLGNHDRGNICICPRECRHE